MREGGREGREGGRGGKGVGREEVGESEQAGTNNTAGVKLSINKSNRNATSIQHYIQGSYTQHQQKKPAAANHPNTESKT